MVNTHIIWATTSAVVILGVLVVILKLKRYQLGRSVPETWKRVYDVNECPHGIKQNEPIIPSQKKLVRAILSRESLGYPQALRNIPRMIIQTNESDDIPEGMFDATETVLNKNPNYDYIYFDNIRARAYIVDNYPARVVEAYDVLIPGAYKADLFRYCSLFIMGGIYIDMGMVMLCALDDIIGDGDVFISPEDNSTGGIYNAFICCEPQNPIIGEAIRLAVENIEGRKYTDSPLGITGPLLLAKAFKNIVGEPVVEGKNYGEGIRILRHFKPDECMSGEIHGAPAPAEGKNTYNKETKSAKHHFEDMRIISTRSATYRQDQKWYNTKPRYTDLWNERNVYN
jgi:mannosyltransferase OCH1-like enzyme